MYAIVDIGGRQYHIAKDDVLEVEKLDAKIGAQVTLNKVLSLWDKNKLTVGSPYLKDAKVSIEVLRQIKAPKKISYKYRRRTASSHTKKGHRQLLTRIKIKEIEA